MFLVMLDVIVTKGLRKSNAFEFNELTMIHNSQIDANLIINGSSKALCQFDPKIIDEMLSVKSYNFGMNGTGLELQNLVYNLYRKYNKKPDYIIQVVSSGTLKETENMHEFKRYSPYLNDSLVREKALVLNGFNKVDLYIPFIKYSGFSIEIINGIFNFIGIKLPSDKNKKYKGYFSHNAQWNNSFEKFKEKYPNGLELIIDKELIELLDTSVKKAIQEGTNYIMIYPPTYYEAQLYITNREGIINIYKEIAINNNIIFLDFSSDELTKSKEYFYDSQHLNKKGAELFTKKLSLRIKEENRFIKSTNAQQTVKKHMGCSGN